MSMKNSKKGAEAGLSLSKPNLYNRRFLNFTLDMKILKCFYYTKSEI